MNPRIVVLSSWRSPGLAPVLEQMTAEGLPIHSVIFDGEKSERSLQIHEDRTRGYFQGKTFFDLEGLRLPSYFVRDHNGEHCLSLLAQIKPDLLINGGIRRILKPPLLAAASIGVVNGHPGLFPKYRGCSCLEWAVYNDDPVGATCHFMNPGIDAGPVIYSEPMPVGQGEPYEQLRSRILDHAARVLAKGIRRVLQEDLRPEQLPPLNSDSYFKVIPDSAMAEVRRKLRTGAYAHTVDGSFARICADSP